MPKSAVLGHASRRHARSRPAELPDVVEGQIAELCRDLAVEAKRIRQLQEQADELRRVIREWAGRRAFAFGIGNRANYRTRRGTHAPPALIGHSYFDFRSMFSLEQCVEHAFLKLGDGVVAAAGSWSCSGETWHGGEHCCSALHSDAPKPLDFGTRTIHPRGHYQ